jgi:hypothetical protein
MWEGGEGGLRVPTSDPHTINACWSLFLLFTYLVVAEAASFDKKELCRSDTAILCNIVLFFFFLMCCHLNACSSRNNCCEYANMYVIKKLTKDITRKGNLGTDNGKSG